jgi:hypothetical protein
VALQARKYKRYKLADHKDFNSLFFREKANLLKMLHNFENKSGKLDTLILVLILVLTSAYYYLYYQSYSIMTASATSGAIIKAQYVVIKYHIFASIDDTAYSCTAYQF